jgi:Na+/proline symporter
MNPHITILVGVGLYVAVMLGVGVYASRKTHTVTEFIIAGRWLSPTTTSGPSRPTTRS